MKHTFSSAETKGAVGGGVEGAQAQAVGTRTFHRTKKKISNVCQMVGINQ